MTGLIPALCFDQPMRFESSIRLAMLQQCKVDFLNLFHFVMQVIHPFDAQADGELSISVGDYVVVRQVHEEVI